MSELKATSSGEIRAREALLGYWWYEKSEADKVIEEKDEEIARLKAIRKVHVEAIESMGAGLLQDEEEIRHQKYKRCLAMAMWCSAAFSWGPKIIYYKRWQKRWLKIADKFKPNSTAR